MGIIPDGPGLSGLCLLPVLPEFPNKLAAYRDDCISAKDDELTEDAIMFDDDIEFCSNVAFRDILRPGGEVESVN